LIDETDTRKKEKINEYWKDPKFPSNEEVANAQKLMDPVMEMLQPNSEFRKAIGKMDVKGQKSVLAQLQALLDKHQPVIQKVMKQNEEAIAKLEQERKFWTDKLREQHAVHSAAGDLSPVSKERLKEADEFLKDKSLDEKIAM